MVAHTGAHTQEEEMTAEGVHRLLRGMLTMVTMVTEEQITAE